MGKIVEVHKGTSLLHAIKKSNVPIMSRCGGKAACLTCKVESKDGKGLTPISDKEKRKLGDGGTYRLACQTKVTSDTEIYVPEDPLKKAIRKQLQQLKENER